MSLFKEFLEEVRAGVNDRWDLAEAARWITEHTYLRGARFSFQDHEFQEVIVNDDSQIVNVQKCSQIGLSEIMARWSVAMCCMMNDFSIIVTFPFSGDAADFARTRIDPFIEQSPRLREKVNQQLNNSEIKQFGTSLMYFRGTNGKTQAISIPADCIVSDEIDRSDPHVLSQYTSRLTHSKHRLRRNFSTPTIPGFGIALEMDSSLRYHNLCKCSHCATWFLPDYFQHVKIPLFDGDLRALTKMTLPRTRYLEAQLLCPHCGKEPSLQPQYREYVVENPDANFAAHGYFVSPFDAPNIITVPDLLKASTSYARYSEFVNQNLGLTAEDASESLTIGDMNRSMAPQGVDFQSTYLHAMGIDMGLTCHIAVGRLTLEGQFIVVHRERCPLSQLEERKKYLAATWKVMLVVMDSQPYTDLVIRMQRADHNLYGAVYSNSKKLESFAIKMFEGDEGEGKLPIHTCQINRDKAFDMLLGCIKSGEMVWAQMNQEDDEMFIKHCLDMKRVQIFDEHQELTWSWIKTKDAQDHYHHALLYLYVAAQLRGIVSRQITVATSVPLVRAFKVKRQEQ